MIDIVNQFTLVHLGVLICITCAVCYNYNRFKKFTNWAVLMYSGMIAIHKTGTATNWSVMDRTKLEATMTLVDVSISELTVMQVKNQMLMVGTYLLMLIYVTAVFIGWDIPQPMNYLLAGMVSWSIVLSVLTYRKLTPTTLIITKHMSECITHAATAAKYTG